MKPRYIVLIIGILLIAVYSFFIAPVEMYPEGLESFTDWGASATLVGIYSVVWLLIWFIIMLIARVIKR